MFQMLESKKFQLDKERKREWMLLFVCILIVSVFFVLTVKVSPVANDKWNFLQYSLRFSFREDWKLWLAGLVVAGVIVRVAYESVLRLSITEKQQEEGTAVQKKIFRVSFLLILASWGCVFLLLFPGAAMNDTVYCMMSPVNSASVQPLVFELVIYWWMHLVGKLAGSMAAYAVLTFAQLVFCAWAAAYAVAWLFGRNIKKSFCYMAAAAFAFSPIAADYAVTLVKDSCFAYFFLLLLLQTYDLLTQKNLAMDNRRMVRLTVLMILAALFRTNGKAVVYLLLLFLFVARKKDRKRTAVIFLAVFCMVRINGAVVSHYHSQSAAFREASGVLTQQMAAVIARDGEMSEEEAAFLDRLLPLDQWKSCYTFDFEDPLKFNPAFDNTFLNEHKMEFMKTWYSLVRKNFSICRDAYLFHTYQMWNTASISRVCLDYSQSVFTSINNNAPGDDRCMGYLESIGLRNDSVFPEMFTDAGKDTFVKACELNLLLNPGWMVLVLLMGSCFLLARRCFQELCFLAPQLVMWLIFMAASPAGGPFRYHFYLLVCLPVSILLTWKAVSDSRPDRSAAKKSVSDGLSADFRRGGR